MVYVNSKKYACEACIKGHRSSNCHHNDRPLFEIKKKGRPVSQCERCREARQARRVHAKCTCDEERKASTATDKVKLKGKRFIPSVPTLPNGLKDALTASTSTPSEATVPRQPVDALLNPCPCKDVYNCRCPARLVDTSVTWSSRPRKPVDRAIFNDGLSALALVASCCSPATPPVLSQPTPTLHKQMTATLSTEKAAATTYPVLPISSHDKAKSEAQAPSPGPSKRKRSPCCSPAPDPEVSDVNKPSSRRFRSIAPAPSQSHTSATSALALTSTNSSTLPSIPTLASIGSGTASERRSVDDTDSSFCCCGTRCECAGCQIHGPAPISQPSWVDDPTEMEAGPSTRYTPAHGHGTNCAEDCPTCIDYEGGIELPPPNRAPRASSEMQAPSPAYLREFLARAASLPVPPPKTRSSLDPTNVIVYPPGLFRRSRDRSESIGVNEDDERPRAFGLVRVPKLEECCGGRCGCPDDTCGCGDNCDGCCMGNEDVNGKESYGARMHDGTTLLSPSVSFARRSLDVNPLPISATNVGTAGSCCARQ